MKTCLKGTEIASLRTCYEMELFPRSGRTVAALGAYSGCKSTVISLVVEIAGIARLSDVKARWTARLPDLCRESVGAARISCGRYAARDVCKRLHGGSIGFSAASRASVNAYVVVTRPFHRP